MVTINLPFFGKSSPATTPILTPEDISGPFERLAEYVHKEFAGPAAETRLAQFDAHLATLAMVVEHLHDEAERMNDYRFDGHRWGQKDGGVPNG